VNVPEKTSTEGTAAGKETPVSEKPKVVSESVKDTVLVTETKPAVENVTEEFKKSVVTKKSESSTSEGFGLVFLDAFNGTIDTVELIIPNPKITLPDTNQKQVAEGKQFLEISTEKDNSTTVVKIKEAEKPNLKSHCASVATDDDFFKLRRDMTAKGNDEEMIAEAKKYFKTKCYRTEQIKYLTALFLTEESKYQFFDAAYMHVSDQGKFKFLQTELKDNNYINRFRALVAN
jgi:hypothetical protein